MTRSSDDTDGLIREALEQAGARPFERADSESATRLLVGVFRDRNRRMAMAGVVLNLLFFVAAVASGIRFLHASDIAVRLSWAVALLLSVELVIAIKIWYWLEMNRLALTRELKRVELRVAGIADRLDGNRDA